MKTIQCSTAIKEINYPLETLAPIKDILFLDIETTGFSARSSNLYMIGCAYYENEEWQLIQWLAENYEEENDVLKAFLEFSVNYSFLIHFNGNQFDIPFLEQKCQQYEYNFDFANFEGLDIYKRIKPYKNFMKLEDCRQKTLQTFLGMIRRDRLDGGELINYYHEFVCNKDESIMEAILLHNKEDVEGMLHMVTLLAIPDLFNKSIRVMKVKANYYNDYENKKRQELILTLRFRTPIPVPLSYTANGCYFTCEGIDGILKVPLFEEEMKYFYSNYRDYYYLIHEDMAVHKSVAQFIEKDHKEPASALTCYTRKASTYLPEWSVLFEPFYKRDYRDHQLFFELTPEFKTSRESFNKYAEHILQNMLNV